MGKKLRNTISILLAAALLVLCFPTPAVQAAQTEDLEESITRQFDAYVASLKPGKPSEAIMTLVSHSMVSSRDLTMDGDHTFTKAVLASELFRTSFIHSAAVGIRSMQANYGKKLFFRGGFSWYKNKMDYFNVAWDDNENGNDDDDELASPSVRASQGGFAGPINSYDEGMFYVVGGASSKMTFSEIASDGASVTYRITMKVYDSFDFNATDYNGDDRDLEVTLTRIGRLLSLGLLKTYDWSINAEMELVVPNQCPHSSGDYRWEFDGKQDLVNVTTDGFSSNYLIKLKGTTENGVFLQTSYLTEIPIRLRHDAPWVLEMRCQGTGMLVLSADNYFSSGGIYLRKAANTFFFGEYVFLNEDDENRTLTHYGVWYAGQKEKPVSSADKHTYRLTNRVMEDGTNMVYAEIDGVDFGPMNQYYHSGTSQKQTVDWVNGRDFSFSYLGSGSNTITDISVDYVQVWENGIGTPSYSYCSQVAVKPTCTEDGYTRNFCSLCGAEFRTDVVKAKGHAFSAWKQVADATCTAEGAMERTCSTCGTRETKAIAATGHAEVLIPAVEATCTESGLTEGKTCDTCGEVLIAQEQLPALGHSYETVVVAPDCIADGYTTYTCACGDSYVSDEQAALGHDVVIDSGMEATCTEDGITEGAHCGRCGEVLIEQQTIPATGHDYVNGVCACGDATTYVEAPQIKVSNVASSGKVKVTWEKVDSAEKYQVYRATSKNGTYKLMKTVTGTTYTNTTAATGKTYYYYVVAVAEDGTTSAPSSVKSRTCDLPQPKVTASNNASNGKVKLTWEKVEGAVGYKVYRSETKDGTYKLMKTVTGTTYTNTSAEAGKTYYYKVKAVAEKSAADSAYSEVKSRTCDLPQPNVQITLKSKKPSLSWNKVTGAVSYKVYRSTAKNGAYSLVKTTTSRSYKDTTAKKNTTYYYKVVAVCQNTAGNSAYSGIVSIKSK